MSANLQRTILQPVPAPVQQDPLITALARVPRVMRIGKVAEAYGTMIRATGLKAMIGELCELRNPRDRSFRLMAEVVGVSRQYTLLTPLGALDGLAHDTEVIATGRQASVRAGDGLLGRILDANGEPIDGLGGFGPTVQIPIYARKNRSSWASGSAYVASSSSGFKVASTTKG